MQSQGAGAAFGGLRHGRGAAARWGGATGASDLFALLAPSSEFLYLAGAIGKECGNEPCWEPEGSPPVISWARRKLWALETPTPG